MKKATTLITPAQVRQKYSISEVTQWRLRRDCKIPFIHFNRQKPKEPPAKVLISRVIAAYLAVAFPRDKEKKPDQSKLKTAHGTPQAKLQLELSILPLPVRVGFNPP